MTSIIVADSTIDNSKVRSVATSAEPLKAASNVHDIQQRAACQVSCREDRSHAEAAMRMLSVPSRSATDGVAATERQRRVWDKRAPMYDRSMGLMEKLLFGDGRDWVCSRASGDVLEVAVGTGRNLPFYPPGIRLTGIE